MRLLSRRAAIHPSAFLNREADIQELLRMYGDAPWERSFQFRPLAFDVSCAYEVGAT
jgi:hypothetical protein